MQGLNEQVSAGLERSPVFKQMRDLDSYRALRLLQYRRFCSGCRPGLSG
jgi:hypothetical protein